MEQTRKQTDIALTISGRLAASCAVTYMALPTLLFLLGWVRPLFSIPAAAAVAAVLFGTAALWAFRMGGSHDAQWSGVGVLDAGPAARYVPPAQASVLPVTTTTPFTLPDSTGVHTIPLGPGDSVSLTVDLGGAVELAVADSTAVVVRPVATSAEPGRYHVVGGCFAQPENADKMLAELVAKGFPARRLPQRGQLHPVVYGSYATRNDALQAMANIRHEGGAAAWLLVR